MRGEGKREIRGEREMRGVREMRGEGERDERRGRER